MEQKQKEVKLFNNKYALKKKISSGTFGVVFIGQEKDTNNFYAIKLEKIEDPDDSGSFDREVQILQKLKGLANTPQLEWSGAEYKYNVIVMDLLGQDLSHFVKINKVISIRNVVRIAIQGIKIMESIHNRSVIHRDLKPENIVIGREEQQNQIFLIDFGISKIYKDANGRHLNFKENKPFIGTARYASIAAHKGKELSRKDDMESLGFVLIYLLRGNLPWQNLKDVQEDDRIKIVGDMKQKTTPEELCKDIPDAFVKYLSYCRTLIYKQTPDYNFLLSLFDELAKQHNTNDPNFQWDWNEQKKPNNDSTHYTTFSKEKDKEKEKHIQNEKEKEKQDLAEKASQSKKSDPQQVKTPTVRYESNQDNTKQISYENAIQQVKQQQNSFLNIFGSNLQNHFDQRNQSPYNFQPSQKISISNSFNSNDSINQSKLVHGKSEKNVNCENLVFNYEGEGISNVHVPIDSQIEEEKNESKSHNSKASRVTNSTVQSMSGYFKIMDEYYTLQSLEHKISELNEYQLKTFFKDDINKRNQQQINRIQ